MPKVKIFCLILFVPILFVAQAKGNYEIDPITKEPIIKVNSDWVQRLDSLDRNDSSFDDDLTLNVYRVRFGLLNSHTDLSIDYNPVTFGYVKKYLSYGWYGKIIGLSVYYFPLFEAVFEKYGIPKELKYLAVLESALNPQAQSAAGAMGLWQFMPNTGKEYNLKQTPYYSGFYDPVESTVAAAKYLSYLYRKLNDWNLAISAYNCGLGTVQKAIARAGSWSYWKVRPYLPLETQAYIPSFIAINYLFNFYKQHGLRPMYFKYSFFDLKRIRVNRTMTLHQLPMNSDFIRFANPQFVTDIVPEGSIVYVNK